MPAPAVYTRKAPKQQLDDYPTPPWGTRLLLESVPEVDIAGKIVLEPAANRGYMVRVLEEYGATVIASDVKDYGAGYPERDYTASLESFPPHRWVITNPPFVHAEEFILRSLTEATDGVAMLARTQFLESKGRYQRIYQPHPPDIVAIYSDRLRMMPGEVARGEGGMLSFAWFIWLPPYQPKKTDFRWLPIRRTELERDEDYARSQ